MIQKICDAHSSDPVKAISKVITFIAMRLKVSPNTLFEPRLRFSPEKRFHERKSETGILNRACQEIDARKLAQEIWQVQWVRSGRDLSTGDGPCCQGSSRHAFGVFEHGFNCLRCGTRGGIVKMVSLMLNIDDKQSRKFVVEYSGLAQSSPDDVRKMKIERGAQISASGERELLTRTLRALLVRSLLPRLRWLRSLVRNEWTSRADVAVSEGVTVASDVEAIEDALAVLVKMSARDCVARDRAVKELTRGQVGALEQIESNILIEKNIIAAASRQFFGGDAQAGRDIGRACARITDLEIARDEEVRKAKGVAGRGNSTR